MNCKTYIFSLVLISTASLTLLSGGVSAFGPFEHGDDSRHARKLERMTEVLSLSTEQRANIESIMQAGREAARPHREAMRGVHKSMRSIMQADSFDEAAVRAEIGSRRDAMTELGVIRARTHFQIRQVLSEEQRHKMKEMRQQWRESHHAKQQH